MRSLVFGFVVVPNFSLIALSACVDPLRLANQVLGHTVYQSVLLSVDGGLVASSDGIQVMTQHSLAQAPGLDVVFVIGPNPIPKRGLRTLALWLKKQAALGLPLGGIDTGAYLMAQAGLLDGYRSTIPKVLVTQHFFEVDRDRYTCSGGVAPLDLMTYLLTQAPGNRDLANEVANLLIAERRSLTDVQTVSIIHQSRVTNPVAIEVLRLMEANVAEPLPIGELAQLAGVSLRSLQRLFKQKFERSAERVYLDIRLAHARLLVHRSEKSVREIAARTGFASPSHLTARYTPRYGASPQKDREKRAQGMASKDRLLS